MVTKPLQNKSHHILAGSFKADIAQDIAYVIYRKEINCAHLFVTYKDFSKNLDETIHRNNHRWIFTHLFFTKTVIIKKEPAEKPLSMEFTRRPGRQQEESRDKARAKWRRGEAAAHLDRQEGAGK